METGQKIIQKNNNIDHGSHNELSIQLSLSGLSFCILNSTEKSLVDLQRLDFEKRLNPSQLLDKLQHCFNTYESLQNSFKSVHVIHENELSTLVPQPLFNEEALADYLKFNSKILKSDYITYDSFENQEIINVYVPLTNINNYIYDRFGEFEFRHFSTILLERLLSLEKHLTKPKMYVHMNSDHFEIVVIEQGQLKLYNTFEFHSKEDIIYYILFTAEQLQLNPEQFALELMGLSNAENEVYQIIYKYVRHVSLFKDNLSYKFPAELQPQLHSHFTLLNSF